MDGYAAHPACGAKFALVVLFMDIWGLREELFAIARRVAAARLLLRGAELVLPRRKNPLRAPQCRPARWCRSSPIACGAAKGNARPCRLASIGRSCAPMSAAILDFCRGQPVDGGAGRIGRLLPGRPRRSFIAAQEFPQRFHATASLHGTLLVTDATDSPHRFVDRMRGEIYCGYAGHDRNATADILAALEQAFAGRADVAYRCNVHAGVAPRLRAARSRPLQWRGGGDRLARNFCHVRASARAFSLSAPASAGSRQKSSPPARIRFYGKRRRGRTSGLRRRFCERPGPAWRRA